MKQKKSFCVYKGVLTYFKDVFDGTSLKRDVLVFYDTQHSIRLF